MDFILRQDFTPLAEMFAQKIWAIACFLLITLTVLNLQLLDKNPPLTGNTIK
ncbi:MAG: hypothetical protein V7L23_08535 [Nostoc sp.]|uniref:hypothetical protein n=1 Tax=Nostoc sp. TaxID=1180 RepID=UPI002FEEAD45